MDDQDRCDERWDNCRIVLSELNLQDLRPNRTVKTNQRREQQEQVQAYSAQERQVLRRQSFYKAQCNLNKILE